MVADGDGLSPDAKDTLARKRQEREEAAAKARAEGDEDAARSIEERAEDEPDEEGDGQIVMGQIAGDGMTLSKLIPRTAKVELETSMMSAAIPAKDGLLDAQGYTTLVLVVEVAKYEPIPVRERKQGESKVTSWKIRQHLRVVNAYRADSAEGRAVLGLSAENAA